MPHGMRGRCSQGRERRPRCALVRRFSCYTAVGEGAAQTLASGRKEEP